MLEKPIETGNPSYIQLTSLMSFVVCLQLATNFAIDNFEYYKKENRIKEFTYAPECRQKIIFVSDFLERKISDLTESLEKHYQ